MSEQRKTRGRSRTIRLTAKGLAILIERHKFYCVECAGSRCAALQRLQEDCRKAEARESGQLCIW